MIIMPLPHRILRIRRLCVNCAKTTDTQLGFVDCIILCLKENKIVNQVITINRVSQTGCRGADS